ncbi:RDD family protein [Halioglobus maricola]|uniref:RDD family protein n=1 Tax=Halioglobus maricola TaxID=2601894 RepID=A0A5P9NL19_9GAMM|nr:RDD family protein [Halioglobus maricola]QFU76563.1 RDD family protein [Halioglobus maricola]
MSTDKNTEPNAGTTPPSPSLLRHLTSMIYDSLLVIALIFVLNALGLGIAVQLSGGELEVLPPLAGQVLTALSVLLFFGAFWIKSGQTLGMQAWRIQLVRIDGGKIGVIQVILRCFGATLSAGFLGLGYLWKLVDRNKRYWHDYLSGTELILLPKKSRDSSR